MRSMRTKFEGDYYAEKMERVKKEWIIDPDSIHTCKENELSLSDEMLRGMLKRIYERAQQDMNSVGIQRYYSVFLSVAGTLLLSLLTSEFGSVGKINAETLTSIAWFICSGCAIVGFVLMGKFISEKSKHDTEKRDVAVEGLIKQNFPNVKNKY